MTARLRAAAAAASGALVPPIAPQCQATTEIGFTPRKAVAHIDGSIVVKSCPAGSTGIYVIALSVKNDSGETTLEFTEHWQRDGPEVRFTSDYPIGENAELVDVRLRGLSCSCADGAAPPLKEAEPASSPRQD